MVTVTKNTNYGNCHRNSLKAGAGRGRRGLALRDSPRTLQRRLTEEGFTFKRPVSEVRFLSARRLIVENHKLSEIATRLGYADASSFTGAFDRRRKDIAASTVGLPAPRTINRSTGAKWQELARAFT